MKKYSATAHVCINGVDYNRGDIVYSDYDLPGLKRDESEPEKPIVRRAPKDPFFYAPNPKISVVITFHNQEQFASQCLGGFERQTIREPYEAICVLDRNTDGTKELIKKEFPAARIIEVDFGNATQARNAGAAAAQGEFICYFDGDDYPFPEYLEKLKAALDANPAAAFSYARCNHNFFGLDKGSLPRCNVFEWSKSWNRFSPIVNTPIMIRKDQIEPFDERLEIFQDAARSLALGNSNRTGVHVREELWHYRTHDGSVWAQKKGVAEKRARAEAILEADYGMKKDQAECTFISLISRDEVLDEYFAQISDLGLPKKTHWFILADTNDQALIDRIRSLANRQVGNFISTRMFVTGQANETYSKDFVIRGLRIGNFIKIIINQAAQRLGGSPFIFMVEDDTLAPKNAYKKLKKIIDNDRATAYASGIECGRGFTKHTGVCTLTEEAGEIIARHIPKMKNEGVELIDGGGWYCWIGRTELLKRYADANQSKAEDGKMLGPDVLMVYDLRKMGFACVVDFSVQCKHRDSKKKEWLPATRGVGYEITYKKDRLGLWSMELTEL